MSKNEQEKKVIDFDNFKGGSNLKPVGLCNLTIPEEEMERRIQEETAKDRKQKIYRTRHGIRPTLIHEGPSLFKDDQTEEKKEEE